MHPGSHSLLEEVFDDDEEEDDDRFEDDDEEEDDDRLARERNTSPPRRWAALAGVTPRRLTVVTMTSSRSRRMAIARKQLFRRQ